MNTQKQTSNTPQPCQSCAEKQSAIDVWEGRYADLSAKCAELEDFCISQGNELAKLDEKVFDQDRLLKQQAEKISATLVALAGLPDGALDGGWTYAGMNKYALGLEVKCAELEAERGDLWSSYKGLKAKCSELEQDLQTTADSLAEYIESHRNIEHAHANQYRILCKRTDEAIALKSDHAKSEEAWEQLDSKRVQYLNDVGDILGQNNTDESLINAAKRVMTTIEFQKKAWGADFVRMTRMEAAIERMRIAGGKDEFQKAFDDAKGLL